MRKQKEAEEKAVSLSSIYDIEMTFIGRGLRGSCVASEAWRPRRRLCVISVRGQRDSVARQLASLPHANGLAKAPQKREKN